MTRRMMSKEVVNTVVEVAKIKMVDGAPVAEMLPTETLLGNVTSEKAQKLLNQKHKEPVTIISLEPNATTYEMDVLDFIKYATVKVPDVKTDEEESLAY